MSVLRELLCDGALPAPKLRAPDDVVATASGNEPHQRWVVKMRSPDDARRGGGSVTLLGSRWGVRDTEGNVSVDGSAVFTRSMWFALLRHPFFACPSGPGTPLHRS